MRTMIRLSACLVAFALGLSQAIAASDAPNVAGAADCLQMTVAASDGSGERNRQNFRIVFENQCESLRIIYWCAEHPSQKLVAASVCAHETPRRGGFAAPLYAVVRQREFQWSYPPGTRIRYVSCTESSYPTSDLRCTAPASRLMP